MYVEYGPRGFQPIGIAFNDMAALLVGDYVNQLGLKFPVGVSDRETVLGYLQHPVMERFFVPQLLFIDRKGVIRSHHVGGDTWFANEETNMRAEIESLLKEPEKAAKGRPAGLHRAAPATKTKAASASQSLK